MLTSRSAHERRAEFTLQTLHRRLTESAPEGITVVFDMDALNCS